MKKLSRKKYVIRLIGGMCIVGLLIGCGNVDNEQKEEEPQFADQTFVEDMSKGLQSRWELNDEDKTKDEYKDIADNSEEKREMMIQYIETELNNIEKYKDEKFEDGSLQELAIKYINLLRKHKEICSYITVDYDKYSEEFEPLYNERSEIIEEMVNNYGLEVNEEYQNTLDEFLTNSKLVKEKTVNDEAISKMVKSIKFKRVSDDGSDFKTYQATVENTTEIDFKTFGIVINLVDKDGVIVDTDYESVENFAKGAKARFEFMTDEAFETTEITLDWWE